ncbi:diguanylate cyclase [Nannocystis sp.]|uniref:sensor domain-containing diguanylate cyclase n=1 Tax=Nannocystis sp. TaxID=1962667 RepID=UPI0025DB1D98|nr:diguanylate cyclase [Nannocystis sp.]MBK7826181.1 diguanylate cyclase [Nannocystis sp.]
MTHLRTVSDLLWRTRWALVVLASAWLLMASGLASTAALARGSLPLALGLGVYAATLARAVWRELSPRTAARTPRAELELGLLIITGVYLLVALTGGLHSAIHPLVYALVSFLLIIHRTRWVALAWLASIAALELIVGANDGTLVVYHLGFIGFFAAGNLLILGGLVARLRGEHEHRVTGELARMRQEARDFRLIAGSSGRSREVDELQLAQGAVHGIHEQVAFNLGLLRDALGLHGAALLWLSEDALVLKQAVGPADELCETLSGPGVLAGICRDPHPLTLKNMTERRLPPYYRDDRGGPVVTDLCAVPLLRKGQLLGIVCADRTGDRPFTADEQARVAAAAQLVQRIVEQERVFSAIERGKYEQEQFYRASELLSGALGLDEVYSKSFRAIRAIADYDLAVITGFDPDALTHRVLAVDAPGQADREYGGDWRGLSEQLTDLVFEDGAGLVAMAVKNRHHMPAGDERVEPETVVFTLHTRMRHAHSLLVLPLVRGDQVLGTICLASARERRFPRPIREMLRVISHQVSVSLQNARMYRAMEERATTDGLTGLTNHRAFRERLAQIHALAERTGQKFALILTDIDHFKKVNDTHGHPVGDAVLKRVAAVFAGRARKVDVVARYGGEEFVLVLPDTDGEGALLFANKLREEVAAQTMTAADGTTFQVTVSMGVAEFPHDCRDPSELIERADQALYRCKHGGRNCVTRWSRSLAAAS